MLKDLEKVFGKLEVLQQNEGTMHNEDLSNLQGILKQLPIFWGIKQQFRHEIAKYAQVCVLPPNNIFITPQDEIVDK